MVAANSPQIRVLHVDDEPDYGELVGEFLQQEDNRFRVDAVTSAKSGLDRLAEQSYDCVVSDYEMPGKNGIEFLEAIRESAPDQPFILFTGKGSEEIASDAITAGVTDYLRKSGGRGQYAVLANRICNVVTGQRAKSMADERAKHLAFIKQHATEVIWISAPETDSIDFITDSYEAVWGRSPASLIESPKSFVEAIHPEDQVRVEAALADQQTDPDGYDETYRVVQPDGEIHWVTDRASGVYENGELTRVVGVASDITKLKESERELREEQAFTESALEIAVDFYWSIDLDGYVTRWSDTDGSVTGYPPDEAIGLHTSTFHPDDHFPRIERAIEEIESTGSVVVEADLLTKDGERIPFEFAGCRVTDEDGEVQSMCGVGRAVS